MLPERSNNTQRTKFYFAMAAPNKPFVYFLTGLRRGDSCEADMARVERCILADWWQERVL